ncbi:alpha/beta hydrolase [Micromonospora sp. WMMD812]|uniref:alpha/beta fold hydrolase n=1 Tax=Micromonospora sp. WMMD812 TaxID=3015152 RepID=UPI00248C2F0B|nr:alpha/beta hydrolase [Micromonospora sp. WMMD812]WBB69060.1 alpha/beta hydrolase [Micromonospora sp. WMMD812]
MQELAFETCGTGPALILVHGTSSTPIGTWGPAVQELAKSYTLLLPYLPGSGDSPLPGAPLNAEVIASQIVDVATRAGHDRFAIAGASLGGPLAIKVAARYRERVTHLASVNGFSRPRACLRLRQQIFDAVLPLGPDVTGKALLLFGLTDQAAESLPEQTLNDMARHIGSSLAPGTKEQIALTCAIDVDADLASITAPTLLVVGTQDNFVDPIHSAHLAERIPGADILLLDGGHGVVMEQTEQVVRAITELTSTLS